jgi:beta-lactamase class D
MKKTILSVIVGLLLSASVIADTHCFLIKENNTVIQKEGDCATRYAPCSTFKVALSLMGYDAGILKDETHPEWPFKKGYVDFLDVWKKPQNPTTWIKNSCLWYSQVLTTKLGMQKFQNYVIKLHYGNEDVSGDKGQKNGLTHAWLSSSLEISPEEQARFLEKLLANKLPVSKHAQQMTRNILYIEDLPGGWKLYGKTGSGSLLNDDRTKKLDIQHGWFIGWIQKSNRKIVFVRHIVDDKKETEFAGPRAKKETREELLRLIEIEKKEALKTE